MWGGISLWFSFVFLWWWVIWTSFHMSVGNLGIFFGKKNVYVFCWDFNWIMFSGCWVAWVTYTLCILTLYQICHLQIYSPILLVAFFFFNFFFNVYLFLRQRETEHERGRVRERGRVQRSSWHIFFIHSSVDGHLGSFHNLAIVESAAINIGVHVPLCISTPVSLG